MPDITMCRDQKCPSRVHCYRYRAVPNPYRQSYFVDPGRGERERCEEYWPTDGFRICDMLPMEELEPKPRS